MAKIHFLTDNAIENEAQDIFNFQPYASRVTQLIQHYKTNTSPLTIGIYGKWGEGKTSFLNLITNSIKSQNGYLVYHFNPWRFNNEEEILFAFYDGLSKVMLLDKRRRNLNKAGEKIIRFSKYLKAVKLSANIKDPISNTGAGFNFEPSQLFEALGEDLKGNAPTIENIKDTVNEALEKAGYKILVVIDDVDRLDKDEIYAMLKLIKLNASFHHFVYIVAMDEEHVAKAIKSRYGDDLQDGKEFLEKIVNIPIYLPKVEDEDLSIFFERNLLKIINALKIDTRDDSINKIQSDFKAKYFSTPREIIKVLNSFFTSTFEFQNEVNLFDLFWLEYIKIKNSDLFLQLKNYVISNTVNNFFLDQSVIDFNDHSDNNKKEEYSAKFYTPNGTRKNLLKDHPDYEWFLNLLFPVYPDKKRVTNQIGLNSRINSAQHYIKYFSLHTERKIKNNDFFALERCIKNEDPQELISVLKKIVEETDNELLRRKIERLNNFLKEYTNEKKINREERNFLFLTIINNIDSIPEGTPDFFDQTYKSKLIETIGSVLDADYIDENLQEIVITIAQKLNLEHLCHFTRKFKEEKSFKAELKKLIAKKGSNIYSKHNPIFKDKKISTTMIMTYWKEEDESNYQMHLEETLTSIESLKSLIQQFTPTWSNNKQTALDEKNYKFLKTLVNPELVYKQIEKLDKDLTTKVHNYIYHGNDMYTSDEVLQQFIFFYKKEHDLL